ncbi:MAG: hypothetical protein KC618_08795, partial [Candidatus Omnitrophica bacterium]|nr:hypothetical protein [Candidatus Omnitrophota bacterium]
ADNAARDYAYIEEQTAKALKKVGAEIIEGQKASFPVAGFKRLPETIQCECLRQLMAAVKGHGRQLNAVHIKEITDLLANRPEGAVVDLPFGVRVKKDRGHVVIDKKA